MKARLFAMLRSSDKLYEDSWSFPLTCGLGRELPLSPSDCQHTFANTTDWEDKFLEKNQTNPTNKQLRNIKTVLSSASGAAVPLQDQQQRRQ